MLFLGCLVHFLQQTSGINMVLHYSFYFVLDHDINQMKWVLVMSILRVFLTPVSLFFTIHFKRKPMFMYGFLVCCACHTLLFQIFDADRVTSERIPTSYHSIMAVSIIAIYFIAFTLTFGSLTWIYSAEILNPKGMGIAVAVNWTTNAIIFFLPNLLWRFNPNSDESETLDQHISLFFFLLSGMCLLSFFWVLVFFREVKDIHRDKIHKVFGKSFYHKLLI
jgi:hypothetical protein